MKATIHDGSLECQAGRTNQSTTAAQEYMQSGKYDQPYAHLLLREAPELQITAAEASEAGQQASVMAPVLCTQPDAGVTLDAKSRVCCPL